METDKSIKNMNSKPVERHFQVGDLVWAKMKGYPYWPGRVESPPVENKSRIKKGQHYVFFLGSNNYAWILEEFIQPHGEEMLNSCGKKKSTTLQKAIDALLELSNNPIEKTKEPVIKVEPEEDVMSSISPTITNNTEKKIPKIKKQRPKVIFPKIKVKSEKKIVKSEKKTVKSEKKIVGKRQLSEGKQLNHQVLPSAEPNKINHDHSFRFNSILPGSGQSQVAVIKPYDKASVHASGILQRPEYIERPKTPEIDISKISDYLQRKNIEATKKKIGFLGLGMMGRGIVKNLLDSGHDVTIWNRTPERCAVFKEANAKLAQTPADVVASCDITFCCVSDTEAVKALVFGNCGVLQGFDGVSCGTKGYVEMTTVDPTTSLDVAEAIHRVGGRYLEAPLCGSRRGAEEGSLLIIAAGNTDLFSDCESCFFAISKNVYFLGDHVGHAAKMNIILSTFHGTTCAMLAESVSMLERCKLDQNIFTDIFNEAPFSCPLLLEKLKAMNNRNFSVDTALKHQQKDMCLGLALGSNVQQPMLVAAAANEVYKHAKLLRYADHDVSAVLFGAKY